MNIVLDTNCLLVAVAARSKYHKIWKDFLDGRFTLCISNEIIEEYLEILSRHTSEYFAEVVLSAILNRKNVKKIDPTFAFHLITVDPDDNKFVDCAIAGNARYIVTEDHHFDVLKEIKFPKVDVIRIDAFLKELSAGGSQPS